MSFDNNQTSNVKVSINYVGYPPKKGDWHMRVVRNDGKFETKWKWQR